MSGFARVESVEAIAAFKGALLKFAEAANVALADAEGELSRTMVWLEGEQRAWWRGQVRKCTEAAARAKEAVRMKKLYKDAVGSRQSVVDEEKVLAAAVRRLEEAERKVANVQRYTSLLRKEMQAYKGSVQRFATDVQLLVPAAVGRLGRVVDQLEQYLELAPQAGVDLAVVWSQSAEQEPMERSSPAEESKEEPTDGRI